MNENNNNDISSLEELKAKEGPHGELTAISFSSFSMAMSFNSDSREKYELKKNDGEWLLDVNKKMPFQNAKVYCYKVNGDCMKSIQEIVMNEELAALSELKYVDLFRPTDVSGSCSLSMTFDDSKVGGSPYGVKSVNVMALRQNGITAADSIHMLLSKAAEEGELISEREICGRSYNNFGMGMIGMGIAGGQNMGAVKTNNNEWTCIRCGYSANKGKYCTECGKKRDQ